MKTTHLSFALLAILALGARAAEDISKADYKEQYRPQFHFTPEEELDQRPQRPGVLQGRVPPVLPAQPHGHQLGQHDLGPRRQPGPGPLAQLDHAIHPDKLGTIFSGSAVVDWDNTAGFQTGDEKVIVCIYTVGRAKASRSRSRIAYSNDRGRTWTKYEKNPVLKHIVGGNRDPKVFWHAPTKKWVMALYLDGDKYALFGSPNLKEWTKLSDVPPLGRERMPRHLRAARGRRRQQHAVGLLGRQQQLPDRHVRRHDVHQGGRAVPLRARQQLLRRADLQRHSQGGRPADPDRLDARRHATPACPSTSRCPSPASSRCGPCPRASACAASRSRRSRRSTASSTASRTCR